MTSKVIASAHCSSNKYLRVVLKVDGVIVEEHKLLNGEVKEILLYDNRTLESHEVEFDLAEPVATELSE